MEFFEEAETLEEQQQTLLVNGVERTLTDGARPIGIRTLKL